jgi:hypothetical protein
VTTFALTLNPSPKIGEGFLIRLLFSFARRKGWRMKAVRKTRSMIAKLIIRDLKLATQTSLTS